MTHDFGWMTVLVTGGTRGIGRAIVDRMIAAGAQVVLTGRSPKLPNDRGFAAAADGQVSYLSVDFSKEASVDAFVDRIGRNGIDVLVNNAGTNRVSPFMDVSPEDFRHLMDVNLRAPYQLAQALLPGMVAAQFGRVINIASIWSEVTRPGRSVYSATKSGLLGMTRALAAEVAHAGVTVNAVSPGFTRTELTARTLSETDARQLVARIPAGRFAEPEEIATVVAFLASRECSYLTGQNLIVDGGFVVV